MFSTNTSLMHLSSMNDLLKWLWKILWQFVLSNVKTYASLYYSTYSNCSSMLLRMNSWYSKIGREMAGIFNLLSSNFLQYFSKLRRIVDSPQFACYITAWIFQCFFSNFRFPKLKLPLNVCLFRILSLVECLCICSKIISTSIKNFSSVCMYICIWRKWIEGLVWFKHCTWSMFRDSSIFCVFSTKEYHIVCAVLQKCMLGSVVSANNFLFCVYNHHLIVMEWHICISQIMDTTVCACIVY
jgi:hypothetical protein